MANSLLKIQDGRKTWYLIWSSIVDAPITYGCTRTQAKNYYLHQFGQTFAPELKRVFERVDLKGVSAYDTSSPQSFVSYNRAGPEESCLTFDELIEFYCRRQKNPTQETLDEYRQKKASSKKEA